MAKFCANLVILSVNSEKDDVFMTQKGQENPRREEDAIAEVFCYEAMRTFGDRMMRPSSKTDFEKRLADICQREFLCNAKSYDPHYLDQLILGNYHNKDKNAQVTLSNITNPKHRIPAVKQI